MHCGSRELFCGVSTPKKATADPARTTKVAATMTICNVSFFIVRPAIARWTQPDTVTVPLGLGHTALGRFAKNIGINPNTLLARDFDRLSGVPSKLGTRVKIYRARD